MELELIKDLIAIREVTNPFVKRRTESGIILLPGATGLAQSQETGELEKMEMIIGFGVIHIVGPDVKTIKIGDGVYYDRRTLQPVPFKEGVWVLAEGSMRAFVRDDGTLQDLIADADAAANEDARATSLASHMPLGTTNKLAGEKGSGLTLVS